MWFFLSAEELSGTFEERCTAEWVQSIYTTSAWTCLVLLGYFCMLFPLSQKFHAKRAYKFIYCVYYCSYANTVSATGSLLVWPVLYRALEEMLFYGILLETYVYTILLLCLLHCHQSLHTLLVPSCCLAQAYRMARQLRLSACCTSNESITNMLFNSYEELDNYYY